MIRPTVKSVILFLGMVLSIGAYAQTQPDSSITYKNGKLSIGDSLFIEQPEKIAIVTDTSSNKKNPARAALYSAIIPGVGQIYNEKYWKVPIVYFVMGGLVYLADYNNKQYKRYLNAYVALTDDDDQTTDEFNGEISADNLLHYKKNFRKSRDSQFLLIGAAYLFNIIDASVDAHFSDYDVGDDLTINISPAILQSNNSNYVPGISIGFRFK
ncbi:MAG: DUF5683 domain-containing protein [Bacteroidota bacterium]|nr:DUF5683 domain-containing protein [Bacteroidota bacterium]